MSSPWLKDHPPTPENPFPHLENTSLCVERKPCLLLSIWFCTAGWNITPCTGQASPWDSITNRCSAPPLAVTLTYLARKLLSLASKTWLAQALSPALSLSSTCPAWCSRIFP